MVNLGSNSKEILAKIDYIIDKVEDFNILDEKVEQLLNSIKTQQSYILIESSNFEEVEVEVDIEAETKNDDSLIDFIYNSGIIELIKDLLALLPNNISADLSKIDMNVVTSSIPSNLCTQCNTETMERDGDMLVCLNCNIIKIDSAEVSSGKKIRSKTMNSNPEIHYKNWIKWIISNDVSKDLSDVIIKTKAQLNSLYPGENIIYVTLNSIRSIFNTINFKHYKYCAMVARLAMNLPIIQICNTRLNKCLILFNKVIKTSKLSSDRINNIFYPYYIFKLFDLYLEGSERHILNFIHLHNPGTLNENDREWYNICNKIPELNGQYRTTIGICDRYLLDENQRKAILDKA